MADIDVGHRPEVPLGDAHLACLRGPSLKSVQNAAVPALGTAPAIRRPNALWHPQARCPAVKNVDSARLDGGGRGPD